MNTSPNLVALLVALCSLVVITTARRESRFYDDNCDDSDDYDTPTPPSGAIRLAQQLDNCPVNAFTIVLTTELINVGDKLLREYYGNVLIGKLNRDIRFDTTARATWLSERDYDCQESDTSCKLIKKGSELQVTGGKLKGTVYEESIKFCDNVGHWTECTRDKVKVELAQHRLLAARNARDNQKGVIGLAAEQVNDLGGATFLQALKQQGIRPLFGLYLSPSRMDERNRGGELVIGCVNENRFNNGTDNYHSLVGGGSDGWKVKLNGVKVGDSLIPNSDTPARLDTGRERLRVPRAAFEEIRRLLRTRGGGFDCRSRIKMTFTIDTQVYSIDSQSFFIKRQYGSCQLSIDPWDKNEWLLGTSFLGNYYTIFDQDNRRVGFARPNNS